MEAHKQLVITSLNLTGFECKNVDVGVSLQRNCEDKRISGVLLISLVKQHCVYNILVMSCVAAPMQFQGNVDYQTLHNDNGIAEQVLINFTVSS